MSQADPAPKTARARKRNRRPQVQRNLPEVIHNFIKRWKSPVAEAEQEVPMIQGEEGNISESGDVDDPTGLTLTSAHPRFYDFIETGVKDLVRILVEDIGCITFSSCQGHRLSDGVSVRARNVGILCKDDVEQTVLYDLLRDIAAMTGTGHPVIEKGSLGSLSGEFKTVRIIFTAIDMTSEEYFDTLETRYRAFVDNLRNRLLERQMDTINNTHDANV